MKIVPDDIARLFDSIAMKTWSEMNRYPLYRYDPLTGEKDMVSKPLPYVGAIVYYMLPNKSQRPFFIMDVLDAMVNGLVFDSQGSHTFAANVPQGTTPGTWQPII